MEVQRRSRNCASLFGECREIVVNVDSSLRSMSLCRLQELLKFILEKIQV
jgi:hypothetical protein